MLFSGLFSSVIGAALISSSSLEQISHQIQEVSHINSGSLHEQGLDRTAVWFKNQLRPLGIEADWSLKHRALKATAGSSEAPLKILLVGHLDTVFEEFHPFQESKMLGASAAASRDAKKYGPVISGPGVADAKGGLILILEFLKATKSQWSANKVQFKIFIAADEETGSKISKESMLLFAKDVAVAWVFEPGWYDSKIQRHRIPAQMGGNSHWKLQLKSAEGHAGILSSKNKPKLLQGFHQVSSTLSEIESEQIKINIFEIEAQTKPNVLLGNLHFKMATRFETGNDHQKIMRVLMKNQKRLRRNGIQLTFDENPLWAPQEITPVFWQRLWQQAHQNAGVPKPLASISMTRSAASFLAEAQIPVIDSMGPYGQGYHSENEVVWVGSFAERLKVQGEFLRLLLDNPESLRIR